MKYFFLQWKRFLRILPGVLCVVLALLVALGSAFVLISRPVDDTQSDQKLQLALCGSTDHPFLQMGLKALSAFDSTRHSMMILEMDEEAAAKALRAGTIAAYVVIPEDFMDEAMGGHILPLRFVSVSGAADIVAVFKQEITTMVSVLLVNAQKGVFGLMDAIRAYEMPYHQGVVDSLAIEYVEYVLTRDNAYASQSLQLPGVLSFSEMLLCGLGVLFLMLVCLPYVPLLIRQNSPLSRMLVSKGKPAFLQSLHLFAAFLLSLLLVIAVLLSIAAVFGNSFLSEILTGVKLWEAALRLLPVAVMAAAFSFFLCSFCADLISGVLLQFFSMLAMCFVCGCMYPVNFFPESIQNFARWLPAGIGRTQLAGCFSSIGVTENTWFLLAYAIAFVAAGSAIRTRCVSRDRR